MQEKKYYGVSNDTFLAEMPIKAKVRKRVWKTEEEKQKTKEKLIKALKVKGEIPEHSR